MHRNHVSSDLEFENGSEHIMHGHSSSLSLLSILIFAVFLGHFLCRCPGLEFAALEIFAGLHLAKGLERFAFFLSAAFSRRFLYGDEVRRLAVSLFLFFLLDVVDFLV